MKVFRIEKDRIVEFEMSNADTDSLVDPLAEQYIKNSAYSGAIPYKIMASGAEHIYFDDGSKSSLVGVAYVLSEDEAPTNLLGVTAIKVSTGEIYPVLKRNGTQLQALKDLGFEDITEADFTYVNLIYSPYPNKSHIYTVAGGDLYADSDDKVEV